MNRRLILTGITLLLCVACSGQSKDFRLGKWVQVHNAVLKELDNSYVDSLPVDRIERAAIDAMLSKLDPYTVYIPEEENEDLRMLISKTYGGVGAIIYKPGLDSPVIINEPYEGAPGTIAGLRCGDEILTINGETVFGLTSGQCSEKMRGEPHTDVVFDVRKVHTGDTVKVTVTRQSIHLPDLQYYGMLDSEVGYICLTGFTDGVSTEIKNAVLDLKDKQGMKKLVLDLRGNGGGLLNEAVNIVSLFVPKGSVVVTSKGKNDEQVYRTLTSPVAEKLPLVILVDSASASASEIVAGALQDLDRATIMGERTYGKGLVQTIRNLPFNGQIKMTTAKYYTPSGRCVQAIDYSNRASDGSVKSIPDSLTHEFKTAGGRTVRDGGGITPDVALDQYEYSRLTYSLVYSGVLDDYILDYVRNHESIPALEDFHYDEYDKFIEFAKSREFDFRSSAKTLFDQMKKELEKDGIEETMTGELDALEKMIDIQKEDFLRLKKEEIVPFIEEEIAVRYYFQKAGIIVRLRYDDALKQALKSPLI